MDLEHAARDLLRKDGLVCEFYAPDPMPAEFVTVKQTARPGSTRFERRAMLTLQGWARTRGAALALLESAVDALAGRGDFEADGGLAGVVDDVMGVSPENGPYRWDDPDVKDRKRWQATVSVDYNE